VKGALLLLGAGALLSLVIFRRMEPAQMLASLETQPVIRRWDVETARARLGAMRAEPQPEGELVRVVVDPMRGRLASSGELLLLRSAWIGARGVRQGVAFEPVALERLPFCAFPFAAAANASAATVAIAAKRGTERTFVDTDVPLAIARISSAPSE